jgi:alkaline phosphatase D
MAPYTRRQFLAATGAAGVAVAAAPSAAAATLAEPSFGTTPFTVGIASGDALPDAVVLWTRLAPQPTEPGLGMAGVGAVPVRWEIAASPDELAAGALVAAGTAVATPEHGWSVHVDVAGLTPDTAYWYRFSAGDWSSEVGRTRTTPPDHAAAAARFAVISCQNLAKPGGGTFHLAGVQHLAGRDDVDFVVHLGDYIYDFGRAGHIPPRRIESLEDYRRRWGQYKSQPALRAMHARFPFFGVPDDHEFFNNVLGGNPEMSADNRRQFSDALQVYWENMPLRVGPPVYDPASDRAHLRLHRRVRWGSTLDLLLVDDRQHRVPGSTILGTEQMRWLLDGVTTSDARWTAIGSGVPVAWFPDFSGAADKWTGYEADRSALTDALAARLADRAEKPFNPVVFSGDVHRGMVTHVRQRQNAASALVATELVGPPMTSNSGREFTPTADTGAFRAEYAYANGSAISSYRGYLDCHVTSAAWTAAYVVGDDVESGSGTVAAADRWRLRAGAPVGSIERV